MSKPVKQLMVKAYRERFSDVEDVVLIGLRGIGANDNNALRNDLRNKQIEVTVVKNTQARQAFEGTALETVNELVDGATAIAHGGESVVNVARELMDWAKKLQNLELKGALMEGTLFGPDQVEALSKFPTRDEAISDLVTLVLSPGRNLAGAIAGPGGQIAGILKAIEEKLENGEEIQKVA